MQGFINENIHETRNYILLKDIYHNMLVPCFPDPEDHLTWKKIKSMAKNGIENKNENARVLVTITKKLDEKGEGIPVSFIVGVYYRNSQTALVAYLGLQGGCKGVSTLNLHTDMRIEMKKEAAKDGKKLRTIFSIVDLPEHANPDFVTLSPVTRIVMMERFGATHIPINFHYPMLKKRKLPFLKSRMELKNDAALLGYEIDGTFTMDDPEAIKDFLDDYYASFGINPKKIEMLNTMKAEVNKIPQNYVKKLSKHYRKTKKKVSEKIQAFLNSCGILYTRWL